MLTQSTAILEWLEEQHPAPALYPTESLARARSLSQHQHIPYEIEPLNNQRVLRHLRQELAGDEDGFRRLGLRLQVSQGTGT